MAVSGNSEISDRLKTISDSHQKFTLDMMEHNSKTSQSGMELDSGTKELNILTAAPGKIQTPQ